MARAMWLALALALASDVACGARYVDYSGVKMPEYGGGIDYDGPRELAAAADDYRDHVPLDVTAGIDYKDEEDPVKTERSLQKDVEEEEWQKPVKKHKKSSLDEDNLDIPDKYSPEEVAPKLKSNHRYSKHKPRRNSEKDDVTHKRSGRYGRYRKDDLAEAYAKDDFQANDEFRDDKGVGFDDDKANFNDRATTVRTPRRKPRDRFMKMDEDDEISELLRRKPIDFSSDEEKPLRVPTRRVLPRVGPSREPPEGRGDPWRVPKAKSKKFDEYSDYYDMQRVQSMKDKLPILLRRSTLPSTTTTTTTTTTTPASSAERELKAFLGAHRQRKEVAQDSSTTSATLAPSSVAHSAPTYEPTSTQLLPTLHPEAVGPDHAREWDFFIQANNSKKFKLSKYIVYLVLIHYLQR